MEAGLLMDFLYSYVKWYLLTKKKDILIPTWFHLFVFIVFGMLFISQMHLIYLFWRVFRSPQNPIIKWVHTLFAPMCSVHLYAPHSCSIPDMKNECPWVSTLLYISPEGCTIDLDRAQLLVFSPLASPSLEQMSVPFSVTNKSVINDINQQWGRTTAAREQQVQAAAATVP